MLRLVICLTVIVNGALFASPAKPANHLTVFAIPDEYYVPKGDKDTGFLPDLLAEIAKKVNVEFSIVPHPELKYDRPNDAGSWDGSLIGEVAKDFPTADLAGPYLTFSPAAAAVVDFLTPLGTYNLQIVVNPKFGLNPQVQYLCMDDADVLSLRDSKNATVRAIYDNIQKGKPKSLVASNAAGVAKVMSGNFAYVGGSTYLPRAVTKNQGKIALAGGNVVTGQKFGFVIKKGSPWEAKLNAAIDQLKKDGTIQNLLTKNGL